AEALVGTIQVLPALLHVELDEIIPPARAVLSFDERAGDLTRRFQIVTVPRCLVRVQVRHAHERRAIALHLDSRWPLAHLRAPVAEILGIREVVGALSGDFRPVELDRLAQGNLRALAQRWVIAARWKSGSKNANQQRGPERD